MNPLDPPVVPGPRMETERLLLRRWEDRDLAPFAAMNADPEVMATLRGPMTRAQSDAFAERIERHFESDGYGLWVVEVRETGAFAGFTGLAMQTFPAPFTPAVEVGWRLAREAWGHGYATEAGRASLDLAFGALDLDEVVSITTRSNTRSQAVMRRLGMVHEPAYDYEQEHFPPGHPLRPAVVHRIDRAAWAGGVASGGSPGR